MTTKTAMLDKDAHKRLLADIDGVCELANIPKHMLNQSARDVCSKPEIDWLETFAAQKENVRGLVFTGIHSPSPETKMMAMCAALIRNYIDARLISLNTILDGLDAGHVHAPSVLLCPNLYLRQGGKGMPSWKMQQTYDYLLSRLTAGKLSVLYVEDIDAMAIEYGQLIAGHVRDHFTILKAG